MKNIILFSSIFLTSLWSVAAVQDTSKTAHAKNIGFHFGLSYSNLRIQSSSYFLDNSSELGSVAALNQPGVCGGFFFKFNRQPVRIAAEFNLLPSQLVYDNKIPNKEERLIFPVTAQIPLSYTITLNKNKPGIPQIIVGPRMVFPINLMDDPYPVLKKFSVNFDLGLGYPFKLPSTQMSAELLYSFGLMNIMAKDKDHYQNNSVQSLYRDAIMLRCYFN